MGNYTILPGAAVVVDLAPGLYASGTTYTLATIEGTLSGQYDALYFPWPNRYSGTLSYIDPPTLSFIELLLEVTPFSALVSGGNPGAAAACIETIPVTTDGITIIGSLDALSNNLDTLRTALNQLQPSQYAALAQVQENNDILVRSALTHRLQQVYPMACNEEWLKQNPGSVWISPVGKFAEQKGIQHNYGYHAATGGVVLGGDYRFGNHFTFGSALGYTYTHLGWHHHAGKSEINSGYGSLYGTWMNKHLFVDAAVIGGYNNYDTSRHIKYPGVNRHAKSNHNGYQIASSLGVGGRFNYEDLLVEPWARADYVYLHENSYSEHGARSIDMHIKEKNSDYIRTDLGVRLAACYPQSWGKVIPEVQASWVFDEQLDDGHVRTHYKGSSCQMKVTGLHPTHNLFAPGAGLTIAACGGAFTFSTHYIAEISSKFWENRLDFTFNYNW